MFVVFPSRGSTINGIAKSKLYEGNPCSRALIPSGENPTSKYHGCMQVNPCCCLRVGKILFETYITGVGSGRKMHIQACTVTFLNLDA